MPKRVRPYGSAEDAEFAGLGRNRPGTGGQHVSEPGGSLAMRDLASQAAEAVRALRDLTSGGSAFAGLDDAREVIASLERVGQDLPQLCEQLARILVVQRCVGPEGVGDGLCAQRIMLMASDRNGEPRGAARAYPRPEATIASSPRPVDTAAMAPWSRELPARPLCGGEPMRPWQPRASLGNQA